jgi:adenosylmethionine-8-amino-7-oxononanoate aminotransferase
MQQIRVNAQYIKQRLREFEEIEIVADIRHGGMLAGVELARNDRPLVHLKSKERINYFVMRESLGMGVHLRNLGNIMVVIPPLAIGRGDLKRLMDVHVQIAKKAEKA